MRYIALISDYDGTLAHDGRVDESTVTALKRLCESGRKLVLVTGRELDDLIKAFPALDIFDLVIAENGALLYRHGKREQQLLCDPPSTALVERLKQKGVSVSVGKGVLATWHPHEFEVLEAIQELGLEHQVIFNKGAVMVLPPGVNKRSGVDHALSEMKLSNHNVVGVGDAENDHALLASCECAVAVANALPSLKECADIVTKADHGAGVVELVEQILEDDLQRYDGKLRRHQVLLGKTQDGKEVCVGLGREGFLFAGPSGSGKSSAVAGVLERIASQGYQFCLIDPEGDYENFAGALSIGAPDSRTDAREVLRLLEKPAENVVVNLLGIPLADRPLFFASLLPELLALRARTARPHWIVVDEAHHMMPSQRQVGKTEIPQQLPGLILITVHPDRVAESALKNVSVVTAIGADADETLASFARMTGRKPPTEVPRDLEFGQAVVWFAGRELEPVLIDTAPAESERKRHLRKYAEGELPPDRNFYFTGPDRKLNLRAQNLVTFMQLAEGIDDETWLHHLRQKDYSKWLREGVKDADLAAEVEAVESQKGKSARESRLAIKDAIERRYTAPA